jgi:hypothetical protein
MPDGHWGYGFPIGGVAAFRADTGIISPGGIGFDINCGMRLIRTGLTEEEARPRLRELIGGLFTAVPSGVGAKGFVHLSDAEFREVMIEGAGLLGSLTRIWPRWSVCSTGSTFRARSSRSRPSGTSRAELDGGWHDEHAELLSTSD